MTAALPPLPVAIPLAVAGLLLAFGKRLPPRGPDVAALLTALANCALCAAMLAAAAEAPLVYWFGGWAPQGGGVHGGGVQGGGVQGGVHGRVLGIGFVVDQAGAGLATFIGLLFAATVVFAWGFFEEVHAHFHVLMLVFLAGMTGFCLTHDLFNLFVWFEVMSVAAFALTGYALRTDALEGALNFTVVNTIGAYAILAGIALVYGRTGALDFAAIALALEAAPGDPAAAAAFALIATGLLVKAAQVPFQFWLADAHAVAPSPVSVIFSGAMVALGVFGIARIGLAVFAPVHGVHAVVQTLLLGMGAASAVLGGVMALVQRHIKRLLAFSTISHTGILLVGLALLDPGGLAGMLQYAVGHGLVKASLFMVAGILLATCGGIDELGLRGLGRSVWPAGIAMALGGALLAGLPVGLLDEGFRTIGAAARASGRHWALWAIALAAALTGAAVLRVAGRVFLGLGRIEGEEKHAPTSSEQEDANRPLWLMMLPTTALLALSLPTPHALTTLAAHAAEQMMHPDLHAILGPGPGFGLAPGTPTPPATPHPTAPAWIPIASLAAACAIAAFDLFRSALPTALTRTAETLASLLVRPLQALHSGQVGDYVAWLAAGLALFAIAFALL